MGGGEVQIRPVTPDEFAVAGDISVWAYRTLLGDRLPAAYEAALRDVKRRAQTTEVLVAVHDGCVVGSVTYVPDANNPYAQQLRADEAGIRMLAVAPDRQGQGVGTALTRACVERARTAGRTRLCLHTLPEMRAARHIYGRLGFRRDPTRDAESASGRPIHGMVLDLD